MTLSELQSAYAALRQEATRLAGGLTDLAQRATVYHHLYQDSGGNHIFPLIAAHGALSARGYFRVGMRLGRVLACQYGLFGERRRGQLAALADFADAFRDINRRVCVDVYTNYHFMQRFGDRAEASQLLPKPIFTALDRVHEAKRQRRSLTDSERLEVFTAHFLNEQEHEVGPSVARATAALDWPIMRWLALKPLVRFAYFPAWHVLRFRNFADVHERIHHGLQAFAWGAAVGWPTVEAKLSDYGILPVSFFTDSEGYFAQNRWKFPDRAGTAYGSE